MSETRLWQRLKSGDPDALKDIYESQIDFLLGYGKRFGCDSVVVEDAIHDLFVQLWQNRDSIGTTDKIRPYLTVALRNRILKNLKKNRLSPASDKPLDIYFDAEPNIEDHLTSAELSEEKRKKISQAFAQLSSREKEVLLLKYQYEMDYKDICRIMDISYQSVRNLTGRAIKKLRTILKLLVCVIFLF